MLKLVGLTAVSILTAEALILLFLESLGTQLSLVARVLLDCTLLMFCVVPTLPFQVFREMSEQIRLRRQAEEQPRAWNKSLEVMVEERRIVCNKPMKICWSRFRSVPNRDGSSHGLERDTKSKEQLHAILDAVSDALPVVDEEWYILAVNRSTETLFKVSS